MNRLWKKLTASLGPSSRVDADLGLDRVSARRSQWPYRARAQPASVPIEAAPGQPSWMAALAALDRMLRGWEPLRGELRVTLSSRYSRFLLVPVHAELTRDSERIEYARHFFVERFGAEAERWRIRLSSEATEEQQFACAVENELLEALERLAAAYGLVLEIVEPALVKAFNASRARINGDPCWFVVAESGLAGIVLIQDGLWRGVASRRLDQPVDESLAGIIAMEQHLMGVEQPVERVLIARYCLRHDFPATLGGYSIEALPDYALDAA